MISLKTFFVYVFCFLFFVVVVVVVVVLEALAAKNSSKN